MKVKLVDPMPLHPLLRHPHTGEPLRAVFLREDGSPVWPILGADSEGGEGGEGANDDDPEDEDPDPDDEDPDDEGKKKSKQAKDDTVSREDFERIKNQLKAADRRRAAAEREATELKRKDQTELENTKQDLEAVTKERDNYRDSFMNLARTNAFLTASAQNGITWHDPEDAMAAAGKALRELDIDETDGSVTGVAQLVKDLAKRKKHLVKVTDEDNDEEGDEGKKTRRPKGASGSGVGSTKTSKGKPANGQLSDEQLRQRFPALR